jgi:hypothetical protein
VRGVGAGVYWEEGWGWVADHDINTGQSLTVKNPRGMTVTGSGESWLYGTAMEHNFLWQYNFSGCGPVTTIVTQTETDYWGVPPSGWAMVHENAKVQMYGSGWYNWFNGNQTALWMVTNVSGNSFLVNVHGTNNVVVGDITIPAYTPVEEECACAGGKAPVGFFPLASAAHHSCDPLFTPLPTAAHAQGFVTALRPCWARRRRKEEVF